MNAWFKFGIIEFAIVALQILFIYLKLTNVINWSWWLVLLPTIIYSGITVIALIIILIAVFFIIKSWR